MASLSNLTDIDLEKQVSTLSRELAALKKAMERRGSSYYEEGRDAALDFYDDLSDRFGRSLPALKRRARVIEETAREHPAQVAAVGLLAVGLFAALLLSRR